MNIGIVGTGNMGGMLAKAFAEVPDHQVFVYNRHPEKSLHLAQSCPSISVLPSAEAVAQSAEVLFLCTRHDDTVEVMATLLPHLSAHQWVGTTCSSIPLHEWSDESPATFFKCIPSLTQTVRSGSILFTMEPDAPASESCRLANILGGIGMPVRIREDQLRIYSDLTSCGPAFLSQVLLRWAEAAGDTRHITPKEAEDMLVRTLIGTARLLEAGMSLEDIVGHIAVPGGVTARGLESIGDASLQLFRRLHETTMAHQQKAATLSVSEPNA
ncbi:MAG: NAD(P)-binding domain-containing protein [Alicyclobacillaceae bacterium]|nr:NAD(P)-binding domain-containing protein [Alicyclobacillaceae bacterium]